MTTVVASIVDFDFVPAGQLHGPPIEIYKFGDVIKLEIKAQAQSIQLALSAADALAVAVQLIDEARLIPPLGTESHTDPRSG
jgi:hypothetical protein